MPQVPRLSSPQVEQAALPNMRVDQTPDAAAFGLGSANRSILPAVADFAQKVKDDADEIAVKEAESKILEYEKEYLYNPETGMYRKEGKDAFGLDKELNDTFDKKRADIVNSLSNPRQKAMFDQKAEAKKSELQSQTMKHMGVQIQKYDDQVTESYIKNQQESAINSLQEPSKIYSSIQEQKSAILKYGDRHGLPTEFIMEKAKAAESTTHSGVISRMLTNGDDITAEAYFNANKDSITAKDYEQVAKELEIGSTRGFAQRFADDAVKRGLSEDQAYKELEKKSNSMSAKQREAAEMRISKVFNMRDQAEQRRQEQLYMYAGKKVQEAGSLDAVETKVLAAMKPEVVDKLRDLANKNSLLDDTSNFYKLKMIASNPETRSKFLNKNLLEDNTFHSLNKQHKEEIIDLQTSLRNKDGKADKELDGIYTSSQIVQKVAESAGIKKNEDSSFELIVNKEIADMQKATGKKLSNEEVKQIANKYTAEAVVAKHTFWFDSTKPKYKILNEMDEQERANIESALKAKGRPVTNDNILNLYLMKVNQ